VVAKAQSKILEKLVDRVVVAVAEVPVVELVGRPEAPDPEVLVRISDLLDGA